MAPVEEFTGEARNATTPTMLSVNFGHAAVGPRLTQHRGRIGHALRTSLERLGSVLKFMTVQERQEAIGNLLPRVRTALLTFMEHPQRGTESLAAQKRKLEHKNLRNRSLKGTDVRTICTKHGTNYIAQLRLEHLRFYTFAQPSMEVANQQRMIFAHFRNAVESIGKAIWHDPARFCSLFENTLRQHMTSEQDMGLSVFIYMRADQWIDRTQAITSPTLSLFHAVQLHAKLLHALATSWESLRKEWVPLLRCTRRTRTMMLSSIEAEEIAEQAHQRHVKRRLALATERAVRALARMDKADGTNLKQARQCDRAIKDRASKLKLVRKDRQLRAERWRWLCRRDLTTAEILQLNR